ncbi:MAG TPA: hypothetical protein VGC09_18290 [Rhodopila sp.]
MQFTRIYADVQGESHFDDVEMPLQLIIPAAGLRPIKASPPIIARHAQFLIAPTAAIDKDWHPAPARQFALFLKGALDVDVSDGQTRTFAQGSFLFLEDTWGKGHRNRAVDNEDILWVFIPVPDDLSIHNIPQ